MGQNNNIYIFGHTEPDADSVISAIAYAYFKRLQGEPAVACRLGKLNAETKYLLKKFGFQKPEKLNDARVTMEEIDLDPPITITEETTLHEVVRLMEENKREAFVVADKERHMIGWVSKSDLARIALGDTLHSKEMLQNTPVENFVKTVNGELIYDTPDRHLNGLISIVTATSDESIAKYEVKDRIVIAGNDASAQKKLIEKGAGMLIVVWADEISMDVLIAAKKYNCPVITSGYGAMNTSRYVFFAPPVKMIMIRKVEAFQTNEIAEEVQAKMLRTKFRSYPVVDKENRLFGYVTRNLISNYHNKRLILVDHNEFSQSVRGIDKGEVLQVIDHHKVNDFSTNRPVNFRNEIVGSTATIIATIFRENQISFPEDLAGLLLGAILSDTLNLRTPTTTRKDIETANILAAIANLDIEEFAQEMFTVASDPEGKSLYELMQLHMEYYDIGGCKFMLSQINLASMSAVSENEDEIQEILDTFTEKKALDFCVLVLTSVLDDGSVFYSSGINAEWLREAYPDRDGETHSFQVGVLAKKEQILPKLTEVILKYA